MSNNEGLSRMDRQIIDQNEICALFVGFNKFLPFLGRSCPRGPAVVDCSDLPGLGSLLGRAYLLIIWRRAFSARADVSTWVLHFPSWSAQFRAFL